MNWAEWINGVVNKLVQKGTTSLLLIQAFADAVVSEIQGSPQTDELSQATARLVASGQKEPSVLENISDFMTLLGNQAAADRLSAEQCALFALVMNQVFLRTTGQLAEAIGQRTLAERAAVVREERALERLKRVAKNQKQDLDRLTVLLSLP